MLPVQVDLNMEPYRRKEILVYQDGIVQLPQLRVNGRYIGSGDAVQVRTKRVFGVKGKPYAVCVESLVNGRKIGGTCVVQVRSTTVCRKIGLSAVQAHRSGASESPLRLNSRTVAIYSGFPHPHMAVAYVAAFQTVAL